ncbi:MAG: amylo-alpha-1,6-glucosidase [Bacteroidia bacterium]
MKFNSETLHDFNQSSKLEWLETNGLGGYASSTVAGANTRRYHGFLIASKKPPVERVTMLSKLDETIICSDASGEKFELNSNQYSGAISPKGVQFLKSFSKDLFPEWIYQLPNGIEIKKTIAAVNGENTTLIIYEVLRAKNNFTLELLPLFAARDFHSLSHGNENINRETIFENSTLKVKPYHNLPELFINAEGVTFTHQQDWYYNFEYAIDQYRGQEFNEDLFTYGKLSKELKQGDEFGIIISTENTSNKNAFELFGKEKARRENLMAPLSLGEGPGVRQILALAADQFIVQRGEDLKTIIAGYHWFSDWGRDTMIALPGLCLSTGRFDDAQKILSAFAKSVSQGMLPNRFPDYGEEPEYNTVDATLWFFVAIKKFFGATKSQSHKDFETKSMVGVPANKQNAQDFVMIELLPVLKEIIEWHFKGTRFNIHANNDGLLYEGTEGQQLTWMDARVGDWVVTPRIGKAVEINALWYNALMIFSDLLLLNKEKEEAKTYLLHAEKIKNHFTETYWNETQQCLYDFVKDDYKDAAIRPNQLFALSLPYPLIEGEKAKSILKVVTEKLYTPVGLRSLSQDHPDYKGHYGGEQLLRDAAYHQGTVWSWLLGPYIDAIIKVNGTKGKTEAKKVIEDFSYHFNEHCVGSISEIFDGDAPHTPRGCIAQAWSVGELLRVITDYDLTSTKKKGMKNIYVNENS